MPVCAICQNFFVRPQSFKTLFLLHQQCTICETYLKTMPTVSVMPLDYNTLELLTYPHGEHPALTHRFFETILEDSIVYLYYQPEWRKYPQSFAILGKLLKPLKLYYHQNIDQKIFDILENLQE